MKKRYLILLYIFLLSSLTGYAQLSQGGDPLPASLLRSADAGLFTEMESFDVQQMLREDSVNSKQRGAARFAKKFFTDLRPDNAGVRFTLADGTKVWQCGIRSKGAYSINLLFTSYHVPEGAKLFIYNSDRTSKIGAFTEQNNSEFFKLPTAPVYGDEIIVEYQEPADVAFSGRIAIGEVNHDYRGMTLRSRPGQLISTATCHKDAACYPEYSDIAQATTLLIINGNEYCTGCLLNNAEEDGTPYLISAAHCFYPKNGATSQIRAQNTVIFFNYQNPSCSNVVIGPEDYSLASANLLMYEEKLDVALLKLVDTPPVYYRPYYAGWNAGTPAAPPYVSLHHPMSKTKKVAIENDNLIQSTYTDGELIAEPGVHWRVPSWEVGVTEAGSSGSPLFDSNKRFLGGLTGGSSTCSDPTNDYYYSIQKNWTYYSDSLRQLKHWLDPKNRGVLQVGGLDPYAANSCSRLTHIGISEQMGVSYLKSPETGPVFSKNSLSTQECAERYITGKKNRIYGVHLVIPTWKSTMNGQLVVNLYSGYETPDAQPIITKTVQLSYLNHDVSSGNFYYVNKPTTAACDNFIRFDNPVDVDYSFFVGYKVNYSSTDTFKIYNVLDRKSLFNSAFLLQNNLQWTPVSSFGSDLMNTSLWIDPIVHLGLTLPVKEDTVDFLQSVYTSYNRAINFIGLSKVNTYQMRLYNSMGQLVDQNNNFNAQSYIDAGALPNGVYIVYLRSDMQLYSKKILIY
ncbi:T9SS type A sorting domain-containing protein [Parabacteroides sp. FAFU027]|uniref:T9SS type A sorting domain-containing protein n=1 Tax=Parabacteroides sp. FAFU027 TaxID=2922715 RepID=UPI001FAE8908|nr:T9SS type A sorting domain-containing protein [Parabacteroides sp. FAFU027]